jgi:hypothetical protein
MTLTQQDNRDKTSQTNKKKDKNKNRAAEEKPRVQTGKLHQKMM